MFKINRKVIVIASMVILLLVAGYVNFRLAAVPSTPGDGDEVTTGNFFTDYRLQREQTREEEIAYIDSIIANANTDQATLTEAQTMKLDLTGVMETELKLEGLLKAKGFADAVVTLGDKSVNVVIKKESLTQQEVGQILEVVKNETSASTENIKIIPAK